MLSNHAGSDLEGLGGEEVAVEKKDATPAERGATGGTMVVTVAQSNLCECVIHSIIHARVPSAVEAARRVSEG